LSPFVAIVILNWNGRKYLEKFLPSVLFTSYGNCRVIVADNASTDDSIEFVRSTYPQVEIIHLDKNYGFARGYNEALKKIDADYYVLLNSDVEVESRWLQPMISLLESHEDYAACQPKILSYHNRNDFEYAGAAGGWIDSYGYPFARGRVFDTCERDHGQYNNNEEIFWASGAAMVIKSRIFHEIGGFYDFLFAHQEEIDLCWRLKAKGYKILSCPASVVHHVGGGTLAAGSPRKTYLNFRNNHIVMARNLPLSEAWWKLPYRIWLDQLNAIRELFKGNFSYFTAIIRAHLAFIGWLLFEPGKPRVQKRPLSELSGVYHGNVVWAYFAKKKKTFSEIKAAKF
jgi:GT2 family glycosyltransferase